jgi:hypothetical protein
MRERARAELRKLQSMAASLASKPAALSTACEPCNRRGRYNVARLIEEHGEPKLTDLLQTFAAS